MQRLLDEKAPVLDPREADTAIFYSINNCQRGLDGISFGNFLIKRVVALLRPELPNLKTFATLSPIPGFCRWLQERLADSGGRAADRGGGRRAARRWRRRRRCRRRGAAPRRSGGDAGADAARACAPRLAAREEAARALEPVLVRLCARYLLNETAGAASRRARDPVAHFHLSNGARVERLNWRGDVSEKGLSESAGLMVNYLYDPARIEDHHEDYAGEGKRPAATAIRRLARGWS